MEEKDSRIIKSIMVLYGLSAKELSEATYIPYNNLLRKLNNINSWKVDELLKLSKFLGYSVDYLLTGREFQRVLPPSNIK